MEEKHMQTGAQLDEKAKSLDEKEVLRCNGGRWWRSVRLMIASGKLIGLTWVLTESEIELFWSASDETQYYDDADEDERVDVRLPLPYNLHIAFRTDDSPVCDVVAWWSKLMKHQSCNVIMYIYEKFLFQLFF